VEAKVVAELASLGLLGTPENPTPRAVEWDDLPKLVYLDAVIKALPVPRTSAFTFLISPVACLSVTSSSVTSSQ
jgi:hypothetical protein